MTDTLASFTPEQYQFIGMLAVIGFIPFMGFVWRASAWKSKIEYDIARMSEKMGFAKGKDLAPKLRKKLKLPEPGDEE